MKKITYVLLAFIALFVNSTAYAVEARVPATSIGQALQSARGKDNFSDALSKNFSNNFSPSSPCLCLSR